MEPPYPLRASSERFADLHAPLLARDRAEAAGELAAGGVLVGDQPVDQHPHRHAGRGAAGASGHLAGERPDEPGLHLAVLVAAEQVLQALSARTSGSTTSWSNSRMPNSSSR